MNRDMGWTKMTDGLLEILSDPEIFSRITGDEMSKRIVGEEDSRKAIFLFGCGMFVENHQIASYNLCVNAESGAGKDYVVKNVLKIMPDIFMQSRTKVSPAAFTYWHNSKNEPDWSWDGKICYLQDISDPLLESEVFKVMCSEGSYATVVKDQVAVDIEIKGKPVMIVTTASAVPKSEMLRRFPIVMLDETREQTKAIMDRQAQLARDGDIASMNYDPAITKALSMLKRVKVKIPFADKIAAHYPFEHIIMRTHFQRLLDLVKASTAVHQYQRRKDEDGYVLAEPADYDIAIIALRQITQNALMIPLTKKQQKFLELCRSFDEWFSTRDVVARCNFLSQQSVYLYLERLQEFFLDVDLQDVEGSKRPVKVYKVKKVASIHVPNYTEICRNIGSIRSVINDRIDGNIRIDDYTKNNSNNSINSTPNLPNNLDGLFNEFGPEVAEPTLQSEFSDDQIAKFRRDGIIAEVRSGIYILVTKEGGWR